MNKENSEKPKDLKDKRKVSLVYSKSDNNNTLKENSTKIDELPPPKIM